MLWTILSILAIILAIVFFRKGRNAVWGGLTIGFIVGFVWQGISGLLGKGFSWEIALHVTVIAVLFGAGAELLGSVRLDHVLRRVDTKHEEVKK